MQEIVVLDFETTGLSANRHRVIEVCAAILDGDTIKGVFNTLVNPGEHVKIPSFITKLTGISKSMLVGQPDSNTVMRDLFKFVGNRWILAHNAAFDKGFYQSEMARSGYEVSNNFLCSLLLARRLLPDAPSHKLSSLKQYLDYRMPEDHHDHRAYSDVLVTIHLWHRLNSKMKILSGLSYLSIDMMLAVSRAPKSKVYEVAAEMGGENCKYSQGSANKDKTNTDRTIAIKGTTLFAKPCKRKRSELSGYGDDSHVDGDDTLSACSRYSKKRKVKTEISNMKSTEEKQLFVHIDLSNSPNGPDSQSYFPNDDNCDNNEKSQCFLTKTAESGDYDYFIEEKTDFIYAGAPLRASIETHLLEDRVVVNMSKCISADSEAPAAEARKLFSVFLGKHSTSQLNDKSTVLPAASKVIQV